MGIESIKLTRAENGINVKGKRNADPARTFDGLVAKLHNFYASKGSEANEFVVMGADDFSPLSRSYSLDVYTMPEMEFDYSRVDENGVQTAKVKETKKAVKVGTITIRRYDNTGSQRAPGDFAQAHFKYTQTNFGIFFDMNFDRGRQLRTDSEKRATKENVAKEFETYANLSMF